MGQVRVTIDDAFASCAAAFAARLPKGRTVVALLALATLGFGGCAQQPQQLAANGHSKEYFPSSVYGQASRRVVENGPVPHGGGQYLVGHPYTVAGQTYYPSERKLVQVGNASWYGDAFHGRLTANGEIYDRDSFTAAHPTMPLPSYARVTNLRTNASMIVRVNDRGPFAANRVMDVSRRVAEALDFQRSGTAKVKIEYVGRASLAGSDDAKLYATLRTDGPAQWHESEPTMVADARPAPARVASLEPVALPLAAPTPLAPPPPPAAGAMRRAPAEPRVEPSRVKETVLREPLHAEPRRGTGRDDRHLAARDPVPNDALPREPTAHRPALRWQAGPAAKETVAHEGGREPVPAERPSRLTAPSEPTPISRPAPRIAVAKAAEPKAQSAQVRAPLPPARHIDLRAIPGATGPIAANHRNPANLRLARARDD